MKTQLALLALVWAFCFSHGALATDDGLRNRELAPDGNGRQLQSRELLAEIVTMEKEQEVEASRLLKRKKAKGRGKRRSRRSGRGKYKGGRRSRGKYKGGYGKYKGGRGKYKGGRYGKYKGGGRYGKYKGGGRYGKYKGGGGYGKYKGGGGYRFGKY